MKRKRNSFYFFFVLAISLTLAAAFVPSPWTKQYRSVDLKALGNFMFDPAMGTIADVPKKIRELDGRKVSIQAFMWNPTGGRRISQFGIIYSLPQWHRAPYVQEVIFAHLPPGNSIPDMTAEYLDFEGTLHVQVKHSDDGTVVSVFAMDIDTIRKQETGNLVFPSSLHSKLIAGAYDTLPKVDLALDCAALFAWTLCAASGLLFFHRRRLQRRAILEMRCPQCGCDLRSSNSLCPECGSSAGFAQRTATPTKAINPAGSLSESS